ncbi:L,D-transpeptidase family protein [uncultured Roseobacter sp.]|uniref:L,D-transpeptidase family protein n=1 Tax=uncultured Roseobacter sp. TaxID=114847 RepID=UPI0026047DF2|nr:L,D-transpeptidase family protein [uncultured Roseobacter sp.]
MRRRDLILSTAAAVALAGCSGSSKFRRYDGPDVTFVVVNKGQRRMHLLHHVSLLKSYDINLGFAPIGHKQIEGDGRTPEGVYRIDRRNPNSQFHLSLGISYPNVNDVAAAKAMGKSAGGDIFIHGQKNPFRADKKDWTWGCIAVSNDEMEEIYAMVPNDTLIALNP